MFKTISITPKRLMRGLGMVAIWALMSFVVIPVACDSFSPHHTIAAIYTAIAATPLPNQIALYFVLCSGGAWLALVTLLIIRGLGQLAQRRFMSPKRR